MYDSSDDYNDNNNDDDDDILSSFRTVHVRPSSGTLLVAPEGGRPVRTSTATTRCPTQRALPMLPRK